MVRLKVKRDRLVPVRSILRRPVTVDPLHSARIGFSPPFCCHCRHPLKSGLVKSLTAVTWIGFPLIALDQAPVMECHGVSQFPCDRFLKPNPKLFLSIDSILPAHWPGRIVPNLHRLDGCTLALFENHRAGRLWLSLPIKSRRAV